MGELVKLELRALNEITDPNPSIALQLGVRDFYAAQGRWPTNTDEFAIYVKTNAAPIALTNYPNLALNAESKTNCVAKWTILAGTVTTVIDNREIKTNQRQPSTFPLLLSTNQ